MAASRDIFRAEGFDHTKLLRTEDVEAASLRNLRAEGSTFRFTDGDAKPSVLKADAPGTVLVQKGRALSDGMLQGAAADGPAGTDDAEEFTDEAVARAKGGILAGRRLLRRVQGRMSEALGGIEGAESDAASRKPLTKERGGEAWARGVPRQARRQRDAEARRRAKPSKATLRRASRRRMAKHTIEATAAKRTKGARKAIKVAKAAPSPLNWAAIALGAMLAIMLSLAMALPLLFGNHQDSDLNFEGLTDAERTVAMYLSEKGLDALHIAAIMGNIKAESNFDPAVIENGNGIGLGLIQWSFGNRTALEGYAASLGKPAGDMQVQLDFLWWQMMGDATGLAGNPGAFSGVQWQWTGRSEGCLRWLSDHGLSKRPPASMEGFKSMGTLEGATGYFTWAFERPSDKGAKVDLRTEYATSYYAILTAKRPGAGGGQGAVELAMGELGKPYVWGAVGPASYDCSGLVSYALTGEHKRLGTTKTFINWPQTSSPVPGDICVNSHHCGIYIGNGKMIHAPETGDVVKIGPVQRDMIYVRYPG